MKTTITKRFADYPFAHRQPKHAGHCSLIHGHNWTFEVTFAAETLDENGFVLDFGRMQFAKNFFTEKFDHTLVLNEDDPMLEHFAVGFRATESRKALAAIRLVPNCGAEGLARYVFEQLNRLLLQERENAFPPRFLRVTRVTVYEDNKNSATYEQP